MNATKKSIIVPVRALLCAWVLAGAVVSRSSAQVTLVSNLGQAVEDFRFVGGEGANAITLGMSFTTGSSAATIEKLTLSFSAPSGNPSGLVLDLYDSFAVGVGPSGHVATFSGSDPTNAGNFDFVGVATLDAHTTYYLIASVPGGSSGDYFSWNRTTSPAEDGGGLTGWTIGDTLIANNQSFTWSEQVTGSLSPLMFSVQGSAVPEPSTYAVCAGLAALGLAFCGRRSRRRSGRVV